MIVVRADHDNLVLEYRVGAWNDADDIVADPSLSLGDCVERREIVEQAQSIARCSEWHFLEVRRISCGHQADCAHLCRDERGGLVCELSSSAAPLRGVMGESREDSYYIGFSHLDRCRRRSRRRAFSYWRLVSARCE